MKRAYVRPTMVGERFVANEYVAACGDSGTVYNFVCNAGEGVPGEVYQETNGVQGLQKHAQIYPWKDADTKLTRGMKYYVSCNETHKASAMDNFSAGYYVPMGGGDTKEVIIWRGKDGNNVHCTTNLDMKKWETAKS